MKEEDRIAPAKAGIKNKIGKLPRILIVEDSDESLRLFSTVFKNQGYRVTTAVNGEEALKKLRKGPADLILSDILMPVMDGFRLLQECKADPTLSHIRFVFLSGAFTDKKDEELGLKLGADAFLRKPIEPEDLTHALAEILSGKPTLKKKGRQPKEGKREESGLYTTTIMQKLQQKMESLEEEIGERKKAESALVKSEAQYRLLFDTMDQGVMCWAEGKVTSANPAAARILGLAPEDLLGRTSVDPIWKAFHEDGSDFKIEDFPVTVAVKTGRPVRDVTMGFFNSRDDKFHWIRASALPQFHPGEDRPYQVYATFDDITDRFLAFKSLQESESRMSAILENTQDAMWSVDSDFHLIAANSNARRLYNMVYGATLTEGLDVRSAMSGEKADFWTEAGKSVLQGKKVTFEKLYDFTDNATYFEYSLSPIFSPSGRVSGALISARDITERKNTEQQLKESEERHRLVVENIFESVYVLQDGKVKFSRSGISAITGFTGEEILGKSLSELIHPDDLKPLMESHNRRMNGEQVPSEYIFRAIDKNGGTRWVEAHVSTIEWDGHSAALVLQSDITGRRQMEASIEKTSRLFKMLFLCNEALVHATSEIELFQKICSIMTEIGGYLVAWIGLMQDDENKLLKPVAISGAEISDLERAGIALADIQHDGGPAATAVRTGKSVIIRDVTLDAAFKSSLGYMTKAGIESAIALPLKYHDRIFGSVNIYTARKNMFVEDDISLLNELAEDLAYGIAALREQRQRKEAEVALKKSEELFRKAVQSTTDIVWDWDIVSGQITWYGDIDGMLGYHHDEFPRTLEAWENALHPDDRGRVLAALNSHAETGEPYDVEYRIIRRDGSIRNWVDRGLVVYDENNNITHSVGACVDITEHRQSEARVKIRRDLALKLAGRIDMETALGYCLDAAVEISGFDTGVIYVLDEKSGDFKAACHYGGSVYLKEHYSVLKADSADARLKRKGKSIYVTAEEFTTPFDEQLRPEGFTFNATIPVVYQGRVIASLDILSHTQNSLPMVIRDSLETIAADIGVIIDRISSRQALQDSEEKYRLVVETTREAIIVAQDGIVKFANHSTALKLGYTQEELYSIPFLNLIHPDDRELVIGRYLRRLQGEAFEDVYSFRAVRSDGQIRWVEIQAVLIEWEGRPATLNFLTDITERWQSEQRGKISRDLALSLIGITDIETAARLCLDAAISISGFDSGVIYIQDEETGDFRVVCHRNVTPALSEKLSILPAESEWARLLMKGLPIYVKAEQFTPPFDEQLRPEGMTFNATIPVQHGDRVLASLGVYSHTLNDMPDVVRNSLETIAADIGIVIERIGTRQELQRSQERYNVIAENTSDAIWSMDKYFRYTYFSPSVLKQRGYTPEEMLSLSMEEVVTPSSLEKVSDGVAQAIARIEGQPGKGPVTYTGEMEVFCKDGSTIWTETSFTVTSDDQGKFNHLIGISRDITERKRTEKALIESEMKYRSLVETSSSGVAVADEAGILTMVNDRLCQIYGYSREEVLGRQFFDFIHPDDRKLVIADFLEAVTRSQTLPAMEFRGMCKDGSTVWLFTNPSALVVEGHLAGFSVIIQDITSLKQVEEALKESEQRYRSLFHHNPAMAYALDRNAHFTSINATAVRISGYSEEEARRMSFADVIAPEYLETIKRNYVKVLSGEPQSYETVLIARDGRRIDIHITSTPIIIDGKVIGVYGIAEDISGQKQAAADLKAALEKASSTLEGTIEAIAMMSELRDPYTAGHQRMVSQLAVAIATELGIEADRIQDLAVAGLMHDVGKVYVPSEILSKPGKLTNLELGLAKAHAEASYNIVKSIKFTGPIAHIVWQHHERIDGSGYPQGLAGDQIMLEARILAVADVVEAMVSHRPYRPALGLEKALDEITRNRAILYDALVVDACLVQFNYKGFQFHD